MRAGGLVGTSQKADESFAKYIGMTGIIRPMGAILYTYAATIYF
jgi:hypothetical protein